MGAKEWGSISGQLIKERYHALYNANPNYCLNCDQKILIQEGQTPSATKRKKFCSRSCAASYNNASSPKRSQITHSTCEECGVAVEVTRHPSGGFSRRKYCDKCRITVRHRNGSTFPEEFIGIKFEELTKGNVGTRSKDLQKTRVKITNHARAVYKRSGKPYLCLACGYSLHVDICHVKAIQNFSETDMIKDINHPDNLIALCPTHHWEFDHGALDKELLR